LSKNQVPGIATATGSACGRAGKRRYWPGNAQPAYWPINTTLNFTGHRFPKSRRHLLNICGDVQYGHVPATAVDCPLTHTQITRLSGRVCHRLRSVFRIQPLGSRCEITCSTFCTHRGDSLAQVVHLPSTKTQWMRGERPPDQIGFSPRGSPRTRRGKAMNKMDENIEQPAAVAVDTMVEANLRLGGSAGFLCALRALSGESLPV
jgi:hypothetical protein